MRTKHASTIAALALSLTGCAMVEYGTHSLGTTPFETPGNLAANGWRPLRIESGDAYCGERTTRAKLESTRRQNPDKKYRVDGSCSVACRMKPETEKPPRTGGWGFGRDYEAAVGVAEQGARTACFAKKWTTKLGLKISGYPVAGSLRCDPQDACLVHYTEVD